MQNDFESSNNGGRTGNTPLLTQEFKEEVNQMENEKDINPIETEIMSEDESADSTTSVVNNIPQDEENNNMASKYDDLDFGDEYYEEPTDTQKLLEKISNEELEDGGVDVAELEDVKLDRWGGLLVMLMVYKVIVVLSDGRQIIKSATDSFFFNYDKLDYLESTMRRLKRILKEFNASLLSNADCKDISTISARFEKLIGKKVYITQTTKPDGNFSYKISRFED